MVSRNHWKHELQRRHILAALGVGGFGAVAGCIGDDDAADVDTDVDTDDDTDGTTDATDDADDASEIAPDAYVEGQSFRMPIGDNPEEMHFMWEHGDRSGHDTELSEPRVSVFPAVTTIPVWTRASGPYPATPEDTEFPQLYESYEITPETISVTIRDDMNWSDGEPVRAYDAIAQTASWQWPDDEWGYQLPPDQAHIMHAPGSFSMPDGPDGKTYELHITDTPEWEEVNGFHLDYSAVAFWLAAWLYPRFGPMWPSHREPFASLADDAVEAWEEQDPNAMSHTERAAHYISDDDIREYANPEMSVTYGAWRIAEKVGTEELILRPNEHHPNQDLLNFDEVILEYTAETQRLIAGLHAERMDYGSTFVAPEVAESFPPIYEEVTSPSGGGQTLALNHLSVFGDVHVRQATLFALDQSAIAQNIHPTATAPIYRPGGDTWAHEAVISRDWIDENLISYELDLERAEELMEQAGWERSDGVWMRDGQPFESEIGTPNETPVLEETVSSQLNDFGMDLDVRVMDGATYAERWQGIEANEQLGEGEGRGDLDVWAGDWASNSPAGFFDGNVAFWWRANARTLQYRARNYYPHDAQEAAAEQHADGGAVQGVYDVWEELYIDIPPLGEPDGEPEPFPAAWTFGRVNNGPFEPEDPQPDNEFYNPPHDEPHEENAEYFWGMAAWTINWWLPVLPLVLSQDQHFLNVENWRWPADIGGEANDYMWDYFGSMLGGNDVQAYHGMGGRIQADAHNPKTGAEPQPE